MKRLIIVSALLSFIALGSVQALDLIDKDIPVLCDGCKKSCSKKKKKCGKKKDKESCEKADDKKAPKESTEKGE